MLHVNMNKSHVNIVMLHVDIIYLTCRREKHGTKQNTLGNDLLERLRFPTGTCMATGIRGITEVSCVLRHQFLSLQDFYTSRNV